MHYYNNKKQGYLIRSLFNKRNYNKEKNVALKERERERKKERERERE